MFLDELRRLIGTAPAGFEWLEYLIAALILLWLLDSCVSFVCGIFNWIGEWFKK